MNIGKKLKLLREGSGFTQEQMAIYLGIQNRSTYSNYELNQREAPIDILERAADLFGIELYCFYEENEEIIESMLTCAFRIDHISENDMKQISEFKGLVKEYLKLDYMLRNEKN